VEHRSATTLGGVLLEVARQCLILVHIFFLKREVCIACVPGDGWYHSRASSSFEVGSKNKEDVCCIIEHESKAHRATERALELN
jgi:hypothetical protein